MQLARWRRPGLLSLIVCCLVAGSARGASVRGRLGGTGADPRGLKPPVPAPSAKLPLRGIMGKLVSIEAKEKSIERRMDDYGEQATAEKVRNSVGRLLDHAEGQEKRALESEAVEKLRAQLGVGGDRPRFAESRTSLAEKTAPVVPASSAAPASAERAASRQPSDADVSGSAVRQSEEDPAEKVGAKAEATWADDDSDVKFAAAPAEGAARPKFSESGVALGDSADGDGGSGAEDGDASDTTLEREVVEELEREGGSNSTSDGGSASGEELEEEEEVEREEREAKQEMAQAQVRASRVGRRAVRCALTLAPPFSTPSVGAGDG